MTMNATNALDEILSVAYNSNGSAAAHYKNVIEDFSVIIHGTCTVTMSDGTRVRLTAEVIYGGAS